MHALSKSWHFSYPPQFMHYKVQTPLMKYTNIQKVKLQEGEEYLRPAHVSKLKKKT